MRSRHLFSFLAILLSLIALSKAYSAEAPKRRAKIHLPPLQGAWLERSLRLRAESQRSEPVQLTSNTPVYSPKGAWRRPLPLKADEMVPSPVRRADEFVPSAAPSPFSPLETLEQSLSFATAAVSPLRGAWQRPLISDGSHSETLASPASMSFSPKKTEVSLSRVTSPSSGKRSPLVHMADTSGLDRAIAAINSEAESGSPLFEGLEGIWRGFEILYRKDGSSCYVVLVFSGKLTLKTLREINRQLRSPDAVAMKVVYLPEEYAAMYVDAETVVGMMGYLHEKVANAFLSNAMKAPLWLNLVGDGTLCLDYSSPAKDLKSELAYARGRSFLSMLQGIDQGLKKVEVSTQTVDAGKQFKPKR